MPRATCVVCVVVVATGTCVVVAAGMWIVVAAGMCVVVAAGVCMVDDTVWPCRGG
jgi:hypothetical protein